MNVIVSEAADDAGVGGFGFFEFALVGDPARSPGTVAIVVALRRAAAARAPPARDHAATSAATRGRSSSSTGSTPSRRRLLTRARGVAEVVIPPRSALVGETRSRAWSPTAATSSCSPSSAGARSSPGETTLAVGDTLLLRAPGARSTSTSTTPTCWSSTSPTLVRRQAVAARRGRAAGPRRRWRRWSSLLATGVVPPAVAGLLAACAMVLSACSRSSRPTAASRGRP